MDSKPRRASLPKEPSHTLARVRNNQRRHRQRRREHIASLEQRLEQAEREILTLEEANAELRRRLAHNLPMIQPGALEAPRPDPGSSCCSPPSGEGRPGGRPAKHDPLSKPATHNYTSPTAPELLSIPTAASTTLCSQAYALLALRTDGWRKVTDESIHRWLAPGFRWAGAGTEGGCRVDNALLGRLLEIL